MVSFEQGLAEDLLATSLAALKRTPMRFGLVEPRAAPHAMVSTLRSNGVMGDLRTATLAVHGPIRIVRNDCVLYLAHAEFVAGDVWFFIDGPHFGGPHACVGNWRRMKAGAGSSSEFWKFAITDENPIMVPLECIMATCVCHGVGSAVATVLVPPTFR